jgi:DNA primase
VGEVRRHGVLIDANQNGMGKTIASVYSVRPHPGAPVSAPLEWKEVTPHSTPPPSPWASSSTALSATATSSRACSRPANRFEGAAPLG